MVSSNIPQTKSQKKGHFDLVLIVHYSFYPTWYMKTWIGPKSGSFDSVHTPSMLTDRLVPRRNFKTNFLEYNNKCWIRARINFAKKRKSFFFI